MDYFRIFGKRGKEGEKRGRGHIISKAQQPLTYASLGRGD